LKNRPPREADSAGCNPCRLQVLLAFEAEQVFHIIGFIRHGGTRVFEVSPLMSMVGTDTFSVLLLDSRLNVYQKLTSGNLSPSTRFMFSIRQWSSVGDGVDRPALVFIIEVAGKARGKLLVARQRDASSVNFKVGIAAEKYPGAIWVKLALRLYPFTIPIAPATSRSSGSWGSRRTRAKRPQAPAVVPGDLGNFSGCTLSESVCGVHIDFGQ